MSLHDTAGVPRVVDPDVNIPSDVRTAVAVTGTPLRAAILRTLADRPLTTLELVDELDISSRGTMPRNLAILENAGVIAGLPPRGQRRGRTVRWHLQEERLTELMKMLGHYVVGGRTG